MTDKLNFKMTLFLYNQEANRLLRSDWDESPLPFKRFLEHVESQPEIKAYLDDCVTEHTPAGFDAIAEVDEVSSDMGATCGPFSTVSKEESAQVYLILKELVARNIDGNSAFYYGHGHGKKFSDMYKGFLDKVAWRLISNITSYLSMKGIEMGLDERQNVTNNIGDVNSLQINQASHGATIYSAQTNGLCSEELHGLLDALLTAAEAEIVDRETFEDVKESVELVRGQMESGKPKRGLLKGALGLLGGVNAGTQFTAALIQVIEFLNCQGFQFPFPS